MLVAHYITAVVFQVESLVLDIGFSRHLLELAGSRIGSIHLGWVVNNYTINGESIDGLSSLGDDAPIFTVYGLVPFISRVGRVTSVRNAVAVQSFKGARNPFNHRGVSKNIIAFEIAQFKPNLKIAVRPDPGVGRDLNETILVPLVIFYRVA